MLQIKAIPCSYTNKIYVIFDKLEHINRYELYKNGVKIAEYDSANVSDFVQPTLFDHDHHTNLFKKDSVHKLMFTDTAVQKFQTYDYQVVAERINESGESMERIESCLISVKTQ